MDLMWFYMDSIHVDCYGFGYGLFQHRGGYTGIFSDVSPTIGALILRLNKN